MTSKDGARVEAEDSAMRQAVDEHKRSCPTCGGVVDGSALSLSKKRAPENGSNGGYGWWEPTPEQTGDDR